MRGIYEATIHTFVYVGQSVNIPVRLREHKSKLQRGTHDNPKLQAVFNQHGTVEFRVLEEVPADVDLTEREQFWIDKRLAEVGRRRLLNLNLEANSSPLLNPQVRAKANASRSANTAWRARQSAAARERRSQVHPGFIAPDGTEHRDIYNLAAFCRELGLDPGGMCNLEKGKLAQYRGWKRLA